MNNKTSLGYRLLEGIHLNVLSQAAIFAVNMAATPLLVRRLGTDGYALYTLMWTLLGYMMILNGGTGSAVQKYAAQYRGHGENSPLGALLRSCFIFNAVMAILGGLLLIVARNWITAHWLDAHASVLEAAPRVFACVAVSAPAYFLLQFAANALYGQQRFAAHSVFQSLQSLMVASGAVAILHFGGWLKEIAAFFVAAHVLLALAALWQVRHALLLSAPMKKGQLLEFFHFSGKSLSSQILWILYFQGDRIFINSLLPLSQLGYYVISSSMAQKFNVLCGAVTAIAFPILTELHGRNEEERLRRFYLKSTELSLFFILPVSILSFALIPQFMTLWLGSDFSATGTWPFRLLVLANLAYLGTYLPNSVSIGKGSPHIFAYMQTGKVLVLFALWPSLIGRWGILGAALGFMIAEWAVTPLFIWYVHRRFLDLGWSTFWTQACQRPAAAGAGLTVVALLVHPYADSWSRLILIGAGLSLFFLVLSYWLVDDDAKNLLKLWLRSKLQLSQLA